MEHPVAISQNRHFSPSVKQQNNDIKMTNASQVTTIAQITSESENKYLDEVKSVW